MEIKNNKRATLKSVADRVGVSVTTVSRVLSGQANRYRISKETEEAVRRAAEDLHYTPNQLARGLRIKRTYIIGLVIPDISNPFFASVAQNIEIEARKAGYSIMLCDSQESTKIEIDSLKILENRRVDGLIICPVGKEIEHLSRLCKSGVRIVIVDRYSPKLKCPHVVSDNYKGALEAVNYFFENGHRIIACIQGLLFTPVNDDRVRGYKDAHEMHNIPLDESLIIGDSFGERNGYIGTKILMNRSERPTAIFATSNLISLGAVRAISEEGLNIPDDISIVSFDDQPYSEFLSTPMTTVVQQTVDLGQIAFKLFLNQVEVESTNRTYGIVLPTKLIIRESVKNLAPLSMKKVVKQEVL